MCNKTIEVISINNIQSMSPKAISNMDMETQITYMRYWIDNYENTIPGRNKRGIRRVAKNCVNYVSLYRKEYMEYFCTRLYNIIKKNEETDYLDGVFETIIQYEAALYKIKDDNVSEFEKAIFSSHSNINMYKLFSQYYKDDIEGNLINAECRVKRRIKESLSSLLEPVYFKKIDEYYDVIIKGKSINKSQIFLTIQLPMIYEEQDKNLHFEKIITLDNDVFIQWKEIYNMLVRIIGKYNKEISNNEKTKFVFDYDMPTKNIKDKDGNNGETNKMGKANTKYDKQLVTFVKYIAWNQFGKIYLKK